MSARRVVLVTGAAGHLGKAVVEAFAREDTNLVLLDVSQEQLGRAFGTAPDRSMLVAADLLDLEQLRRAVEAAESCFGGVDVLCHLAGGFRMGEPVHRTSDQDWEFLFDLNARSLFNIARVIVPSMLERGGGKIVTVGAGAAQKGVAQMGAYCASKASAIRLTESMSAELRDRGINVNCVLPSIIDTPANRHAMQDADPRRWVTPQALAEVIVFLASDAARAIHGAAVPVNGLS